MGIQWLLLGCRCAQRKDPVGEELRRPERFSVFQMYFQECTDGPKLLVQLLAKDPDSLFLS